MIMLMGTPSTQGPTTILISSNDTRKSTAPASASASAATSITGSSTPDAASEKAEATKAAKAAKKAMFERNREKNLKRKEENAVAHQEGGHASAAQHAETSSREGDTPRS